MTPVYDQNWTRDQRTADTWAKERYYFRLYRYEWIALRNGVEANRGVEEVWAFSGIIEILIAEWNQKGRQRNTTTLSWQYRLLN